MNDNLIIVDAYSSGNLLAPEFRSREVVAYHVQSTKEIWPTLVPTFHRGDFVGNFPFDGDFEKLVSWARELSPIAVIAGTETGVELADRLSEALAMPTSNGTKMSAARRNKYLMIEACRNAGLRVAEQIRSSDWVEAKLWLEAKRLKKFVIKPIQSAWTDQVTICESVEAGEKAFGAIVGTTNKLGLLNDYVLVQEFLEGTEYFINSVSYKSRHYFTDIWRYQKRSLHGHDCIYDTDVLCPSDGPAEISMANYVGEVLDALEVKFGPAHAEVMWGPQGPVLVEIGTRLDGLTLPDFNRQALGFSALDLTCDVYQNPDAFLNATQKPYTIRKHARTVYLTSYVSGIISGIPGEAKIRELSSFFQMRLRVKPGDSLAPTTNFFTAPGFVSLTHEKSEILENDYRFIRQWEKDRLFDVRKDG